MADKPFNNPFGALADLKQALPSKPAPAKALGPERAVVRLERKGRGGKEVTVVDKLELKPDVLGEWLKALKQALGCGGAVEDGTLVLQGDQRERLPALLEARGVRKVIRG